MMIVQVFLQTMAKSSWCSGKCFEKVAAQHKPSVLEEESAGPLDPHLMSADALS